MDIRAKIASLGLTLPPPPKPGAQYVPWVRTGNLVFVAGQVPLKDGELVAAGHVPSQVDMELAQKAAQQCALNGLALVDEALGGDWSRFVRVVRVGVWVSSDDDFTEQHLVANGASELLVAVLGDAGRHARAAVAANNLPIGAAVEVEMLVEVSG